MEFWNLIASIAADHWHVWLVTTALVVAAVIDGIQLKVPNWLTFPFIITGWIYSSLAFAFEGDAWYAGLGYSLLGTAVGCALLLPAYAIGGMGAGDVKLLMGVGAWMHSTTTFYGFCVSAVVGGVLAVGIVLSKQKFTKHYGQFWLILHEITTIRDPDKLSGIAAERKSSMQLLPYGIPIAIGTIAYFAWMGMFV